MGSRDGATLRVAHRARARRRRRGCRGALEEAAGRLRRARPALRSRRGRCSPSAGRSGAYGSGAPPARRSSSAEAAFDELGSPGWAEQARSELARVGARRPAPAGELTPTERRVAELAAEGLANKEIAQALFVTVSTVEVHLSNAYAKLGIRSRTQLAARLAAPAESAR